METPKETPKETVIMKHHLSGEVQEVEASPDKLIPLMAAGWHQVPADAAPASAPESEKQ